MIGEGPSTNNEFLFHGRLYGRRRQQKRKRIRKSCFLIDFKLTTNFVPIQIKLLKFFFLHDISNTYHLIRFPFFPALSSTKLSGIPSCNMGFFREDIVAVHGFNQDFVGWGCEDSELVVRFYRYALKRKEHPFMAICFHLWHEENERKRLGINDEL